MNNEQDRERDDSHWKRVLGPLDSSVVPPDLEFLDRLRHRSMDEFAGAQEPSIDASKASVDTAQVSPASQDRPVRRNKMFTLLARICLTTSLAALFAAFLVPVGQNQVSGAAPFSEILDKLRGASTLQLELVKGNQTSNILVRSPGLVRKEDSPQRYEIAAGSRWWRIDETENTVTEGDSPWFLGSEHQVDLLRMLDVGVSEGSELLTARPVDRSVYLGHDCFSYRVELPAAKGKVRINAFADATTRELIGLVARNPEAPADGVPLAELRLLALNQAVGDEKFAVAKSLTEDGRIGKVSDAQGIIVLRPMLAQRWTPVCRETLLRPGDWLRTELRGANAVKVSLTSEVVLTLGPGTLIECISPSQARLHSGQVQVQTPAGKPAADTKDSFVLLAPRDGQRSFKPEIKQLVRVDKDEKIVDVAQTPVWLAGFEGTTNNESLGSLIVNLPDGRNEPLTVGYHKVSVEIRDQIARTTIEESFVNHTAGRLEGIFHFPLPQDASISGFGMWIGNDLIEADVVEKQRAREIYETILREKRDPGLLEWTGGNIFKARVFPIEPHSEKRVKIVYTQVLPLRANRYQYSYGLRSEMLRTKPLRELSLNVTISSALPLKNVTCPTHSVRTQKTGNSAQVEFSAQEYTPSRDFEVVCEVGRSQSDVVLIPHRRGDDGYFLVQVTPPVMEGNWQRELLPDGKPLNIVLLCDTSASMNADKRKQQAEFVETVLSSLGKDDRFQLACADVGTAWGFAEPAAPNAQNIAKARSFLDDRISLGWTDLDRAFGDVLKKSAAESQVIYIGDGIVSAGNTDPAAFVKRLTQLFHSSTGRTFHSVTVGNTSESVVLRGIASVGGGSARSISGGQSPQVVALELLNEIAQPGLRNMEIEFRGLKVAAVYPGQLPNLAAGTQQILVGRYLPEGKDQSGEIVVTGMRGTEKVRYAARVSLKDAEAGNSFIPRLWARSHLDQLLGQGNNAAIRDEIIALSEEFHIITPYTSLLVLETDADRERFGVRRRYEMRDGEKFFAEGKSKAHQDLLQVQMKRAGTWRLGLRRQILRDLMGMGRNLREIQQQTAYFSDRGRAHFQHAYNMPGEMPMSGGMGGGMGSGPAMLGRYLYESDESNEYGLDSFFALGDQRDKNGNLGLVAEAKKSLDGGEIEEDTKSLKDAELLSDLAAAEPGLQATDSLSVEFDIDGDGIQSFNGRLEAAKKQKSERGVERASVYGGFGGGRLSGYAGKPYAMSYGRRSVYGPYGGGYPVMMNYTSWVQTLFPSLTQRPTKAAPEKKDPETWSPQALELSRQLLRTDSLLKLDGGIEVKQTAQYWEPRSNRQTHRNVNLAIYSRLGWLTRGLNPKEQTIVNYCTPQERGVYSLAFLLGRVRSSADMELKSVPLNLDDWSLAPLHESYGAWTAAVEPAGENRVTLILKSPDSKNALRVLIDTTRKVVLKHEWLDDGKVTASLTHEDFVEVAGRWWAKASIRRDDKGRKTSETTLDIQSLSPQQHTDRMAAELVAKSSVQFIHLPFVKLKNARQRTVDGAATFDDELSLILHNAQKQQWDEMWKHVDAVEEIAADKPGVRWLRTMLYGTIRRNEDAQKRLTAEAQQIIAKPPQDEIFLIEFLVGQFYSLSAWPEFHEFIGLVKPIYERQPADLQMMLDWNERLAQCYEGLGRSEQMLAVRKMLAEAYSWDVSKQADYARRLGQFGKYDEAHAWLRKELDKPVERSSDEVDVLRVGIADLYRTQARWPDLLKFTTEWISKLPESTSYNSAYSQHLAALVYNDQLGTAETLVRQWMKEAQVEGRLSPVQAARMDAAMNFALASSIHLSFRSMDPQWFEPLAEAVRFFIHHPLHSGYAVRIMEDHRFSNSDMADRIRGEFLKLLQSSARKLSPSLLQKLIGWTLSGRMELAEPLNGRRQLDASEIPGTLWSPIADEVKTRWKQSEDKDDRNTLSESLVTIYRQRFSELLLPFLRERIENAPAQYKPSYIAALFDALLSTAWTAEIEQEAFARLRDLSDAEDAGDRLARQLPALYRLVDAMLANRQAASQKKFNDEGGQDKLTRKELAAKKAEFREIALKELAERLKTEIGREDSSLATWSALERAWINVQRNEDLPDVEKLCWDILGKAPKKADSQEADDDSAAAVDAYETVEIDDPGSRLVQEILKQRALTTVMRLATRKQAAEASVKQLLAYLDAGIALGGDDASLWRSQKVRMLIALDRADELERQLREWIGKDVSTAPWRQMLARLMAERGKIDDAIQLFEACEKDKLLSAADYRMLADWYLIVDRRTAYERSRIEAFKQAPENHLHQMLYASRNRLAQQPQTEVDDETLFVLKALFEKSGNPENYMWQLREIYAATRDFRVLQVLPDAVLGRSAQQIYAFLQGVSSHVLYELRKESTADEILARLKTLREGDRTNTDLRALDLFEALVERKSAELQNQAGVHIDACVAALERAFERQWADGEPRLMATFLYHLGGLPSKLADEQLRELGALQKLVPPGSRDHLSITNDRCNLIGWNYTRFDEALREMEVVVREYEQAHDGIWPHQDNHILGSFISLYEGANRHAMAETVLQRFMKHPEHPEQKKWLSDRLMSLYNHALEHDGAVSLGTGREKLFEPIIRLNLMEIDSSLDEMQRHNLVARIVTTFDIAQRHNIAAAKPAIQKFAFEQMPAILKRQTAYYRSTATTPVNVIAQLIGAKGALQYIVERIEQYPQYLEISWDNSWQAFCYELAHRRQDAGSTDLDDRVLKIAVRELQRELRTGENRSQYIYHRSYQYFWQEKTEAFAKAAEAVLAENKSSGRRVMAVAQYLWQGLLLQPRAIEILLIAHKNGLLEESAQVQLVHWLHEQHRFAESIPILEPLVVLRPDYMRYRTLLMTGYHRSKRPQQLVELIQQTHDHFHEGGRWTEGNIAEFADACFNCDHAARAVEYGKEAIALHQRANPGSGLNDATLAGYYHTLAAAYSSLGQTKAAIDAASAAIVCWGAHHDQRVTHVATLQKVMSDAKDLDDYVRDLDADVQKTGQDSPILRKSLGVTFQAKGDYRKAITQYVLATELQPNDADVRQALILCYDAIQDNSSATKELLKLIDLKPHDLALYQQLANRMKNNEAEAERAATSIIEAAPNEAENQAAMAELRQSQNRWDEAIPHWRQVAELRRLEPNGLLKLAEAELHEKQWDAAKETITRLRKTEWPQRFGDVPQQINRLESQLPKSVNK